MPYSVLIAVWYCVYLLLLLLLLLLLFCCCCWRARVAEGEDSKTTFRD